MRVSIAGAGIVGLTCAWWLQEAGHEVTVYDPSPGTGASYAAAGMIAPAGEAWYGEETLLRLGLASAALWPSFAERIGVPLGQDGAVLVARDASDLAVVRRSVELLARCGVPVSDVDVLDLEPTLSDRVVGGAWLPTDSSVDPRVVTATLLGLLDGRVVREPAPPYVTVRCTGGAAHPSIHPVRGEILRIRSDDPPRRVVRGLVHGEAVYLVPRDDGEVVVGATSEHRTGPLLPTVGGVARLLDAARALVPSLEQAAVLEVLARDRPGTPDNGPLLGRLPTGELIAAGHHRGGVLLAPITATAVLALVEGTAPPPETLPFHPSRFDQEVSPA
ncbi:MULTISPECIES: FAD-dependent oxidoreductase [unclassified Nocardioides]|uniref:FAD-dependent oxidoreductase n=1 Tax=unclassified Nocardioides TaxID=2615069 RepID=UPI0036070D3F